MIKIRLEKWENSLVMQVLDQDNTTEFTFKASNGWQFLSREYPYIRLDERVLFVRGESAIQDKSIIVQEFDDNIQRDVIYEELLVLFKEYADRDKLKSNMEGPNIFTLI